MPATVCLVRAGAWATTTARGRGSAGPGTAPTAAAVAGAALLLAMRLCRTLADADLGANAELDATMPRSIRPTAGGGR